MNVRRMLPAVAAIAIGLVAADIRAVRAKDDDRKEQSSSAPTSQRVMISHALAMAIEGSSLQLAARQTSAAQPGQPQQPGQVQPALGAQTQARIQELQNDGRANFDSASKLFNDVREQVASDKSDASCRRFYDAAARYTQTLSSLLSQQPSRIDPQQRTAGAPAATQGWITNDDIATIRLTNHAVMESLASCALQKYLEKEADKSSASETLRDHAKEMAAHSVRCIQKLAQENRAATGNVPAQAAAANDVASVQALARQAQELVQLIQDESKDQRQHSNESDRK
jgi:hypothetical protein